MFDIFTWKLADEIVKKLTFFWLTYRLITAALRVWGQFWYTPAFRCMVWLSEVYYTYTKEEGGVSYILSQSNHIYVEKCEINAQKNVCQWYNQVTLLQSEHLTWK